jgi:hypothetical protein
MLTAGAAAVRVAVHTPVLDSTYLYTPSVCVNHKVLASWNVMLLQPPFNTVVVRLVPGNACGTTDPDKVSAAMPGSTYTLVQDALLAYATYSSPS